MLQLSTVTDCLLISNARSACSNELIQKEEVTHCINVSKQQPFPSMRVSTFRIPVYDDPQEDLYKYFDCCADAIASEAERGGCTFVYCKNGCSRSATVCVAFLMKHQGLTLTDAFQVTVATRSVPYPAQMITAVNRSCPYPDQMVDQPLETTSTALNVSGDQDT